MRSKVADNQAKGVYLISEADYELYWCGEVPAPVLSLVERCRLALAYMRSNGHGPILSIRNFSLIKAAISRWKSPQVSSSGNPIVTAGLSIEEEWTRFNLTECVLPQALHGSFEAAADSSSRCL